MSDWTSVATELNGFLVDERFSRQHSLIRVHDSFRPDIFSSLFKEAKDTTHIQKLLKEYIYGWIMANALEMTDDSPIRPFDLHSPYDPSDAKAQTRWEGYWQSFGTDLTALLWHLRALMAVNLFRRKPRDDEDSGDTKFLRVLHVFVMAKTFSPMTSEQVLKQYQLTPDQIPKFDMLSEQVDEVSQRGGSIQEACRKLKYYKVVVHISDNTYNTLYVPMPPHVGTFLCACAMLIRLPDLFRQYIRSITKSKFETFQRLNQIFDQQKATFDETFDRKAFVSSMHLQMDGFLKEMPMFQETWDQIVQRSRATIPVIGLVLNVLGHTDINSRILPMPWGMLLQQTHDSGSTFSACFEEEISEKGKEKEANAGAGAGAGAGASEEISEKEEKDVPPSMAPSEEASFVLHAALEHWKPETGKKDE